jgi:hypothetical protein
MNWLSDEFQQPIIEKFWAYLDKIRISENIYIEMYDTIEEMNPNRTPDKYAAGTYVHLKPAYDTEINRIIHKAPKIRLVNESKNTNVCTYAHELGHHFAITKHGDDSEEAADAYIMQLGLECLDRFELVILGNKLEIHSKVKLPFNRNDEFDRFAKIESDKLRHIEVAKLNYALFGWILIVYAKLCIIIENII